MPLRVREAAERLDVTAAELIDWLRKRGVAVRGPSSVVSPEVLKPFRKARVRKVAIERRTKGERRNARAPLPPGQDARAPVPSLKDRRKVKAPPLLAGKRALVDGSNVAFAGGKKPRLEVLVAVVGALKAAGAAPVEVVCDATLRHHFREHSSRDFAAFEKHVDSGVFGQAPPGHTADEVLLVRLQTVSSAVLVSNDSFGKDERRFAPPDLPARQIKLYASDDAVTLLLPAAMGGGALTRPFD